MTQRNPSNLDSHQTPLKYGESITEIGMVRQMLELDCITQERNQLAAALKECVSFIEDTAQGGAAKRQVIEHARAALAQVRMKT